MKQKIQKLAGWLTALSVGFSLFAVPVFAEANTYHIKTAGNVIMKSIPDKIKQRDFDDSPLFLFPHC